MITIKGDEYDTISKECGEEDTCLIEDEEHEEAVCRRLEKTIDEYMDIINDEDFIVLHKDI